MDGQMDKRTDRRIDKNWKTSCKPAPFLSVKKGGPYGPQMAYGPAKNQTIEVPAIWPSPPTFSVSGSSGPFGLNVCLPHFLKSDVQYF